MASDVAHPEPVASSLAGDASLTNGGHNQDHMMSTDVGPNVEAFGENATISKVDTSLDVSNVPSAITNPAGPTPVEDVAPGIAPVADFIPKDAPTSHPTPPPDEPMGASEAAIDTEMTAADLDTQKDPTPQPDQPNEPSSAPPITSNTSVTTAPSTESSLVRPREEDDGDEDAERAAKRSRTEEGQPQEAVVDAAVEQIANPPNGQSAVQEPAVAPPPVDTAAAADVNTASQASEAPAEPQIEAQALVAPTDTHVDTKLSDVPATNVPNGDSVPSVKVETSAVENTPMDTDAKPSVELFAQQSATSAQQSASSAHKYSQDPMTPGQLRVLQEKMKNLKKTKNSLAFLHPVDPVALNIPTYTEIVKQPMDLNTMEQKLKSGKYASVQDFANDFDLIIQNTLIFNGPNHAVTQAGMSMDAYFRRMMESVPSTNQPAPQKAQPKKASPKPSALAARRESRSAAAAVAPAAITSKPAPAETFALQPDGTPQIRRESTTNRPARAIKPPPARELAYAKPKRKEHQLELKFSENVLNQIRSQKYANVNSVFLAPVDPVALNIPHYRQVIKHPMDLGTMAQKLKHGQYGRASEVKKDFDLMISNCITFNPQGNPIRDMGIQLQRDFEELWRSKDTWEKKRKVEAQRANSASAEDESGDEEEEEEEETAGDQTQTIIALQKQLADMQSALAGLNKPAAGKPKKAKAPKAASKKGSAPAPKSKASSSKPKPSKKPKQVTYEEKQEISEAVGNMDNAQVEELTRIITSNCKKYADQEEMELEIDDLPNDVQAMLLNYVRGIFGNPNKRNAAARQESPDDLAAMDDDDFEPERRGAARGGNKRKKHKPMGKEQQQATINNIQKQLAQFQNAGASGSASPTGMGFQNQGAETSGDDESEESEEE